MANFSHYKNWEYFQNCFREIIPADSLSEQLESADISPYEGIIVFVGNEYSCTTNFSLVDRNRKYVSCVMIE